MQRKLWLALAVVGSLSVGCPRVDPEICNDNIDNDEDGAGDCADVVDCSEFPACKQEICDNGVDDNGDNLQDCADPSCANAPECVESNCGDNLDNDGDTDIDCDDSDCDANALCQTPAEICNNGLDDDLDGDADCADTDCANAANCQGPENCNNDLDDDADGDVDCADAECAADLGCAIEAGNCADGVDNDGDTFVDCNDFDCDADPICIAGAENCVDGIDNDGDSFIDCDDFDCGADPACGGGAEICTDGIDNDGDTFVDCNDFDCDTDPACVVAEICNNGISDDGDNFIDCDDFDCDADPACAPVGGVLKIQDIQLNPQDNAIVTIEQVFVTATKGAAGQNVTLILQEPQGETIAGLTYPERAGIGVFIQSAQSANFTLPSVGQCVTVSGSVGDFNGQTQIDTVTTLTIIADASACGAAPVPFVIPRAANPAVTFADVATDLDPLAADNQEGALTEVYEGVLVTVQNVRVAADVDNFREFPIAEQANAAGPRLNIDDFFVVYNTIADLGLTVNQNLSSVTGIYNDVFNFKIQIRVAGDIVP